MSAKNFCSNFAAEIKEDPSESSQARLLGADKPNGAKAHSSGELKLSSSQVALSYRATVATDAFASAPLYGEDLGSAMSS